ncbi:glycosyltransferase family 2 protein [Streptomyces scopuliridis]|uniref:glycosyltransferase family 2 protein n=1 Tax=Streptomyces scopuliridis TaxID=452529 RepID=UPI0036CF3BE7
MAVKVTVVVPTYNSGIHIEPLVGSLLGQTLPSDEFEVLFVDDGSTDETPERLAALVAEHGHFRMERIPNSGWPGKPRNIGVERANGHYVQFADHDDRLAPEALERLYAMAARNDSDIVIGKVASNFRSRGVPYGLMTRTRESCTVRNAPLIDSLTPHKMFRTAFLREHGIAHPEGPWILEDQLFMVRAYLKASVVSVLGDYVCYAYWAREDAENAGTAAMDPRRYYGNLREVMATVVAGTEPGPERDRLLRRFYRVEMLHRLGEPPRGLLVDPPFRDDPFEVVRELAEEFMTDGVHTGLAAVQRTRSALLRENRPAELTEFTRRQTDLSARCAVERAGWSRDRFKASFTARFAGEPGPDGAHDGSGLLLARRGDRYFLAPALTDGVLSEPVDVTDELKSFKAEVLLRHAETAHVWLPERETSLVLEEEPAPDGLAGTVPEGTVLVRPVVRGTVAIDPLRVAGGGPLGEGVWEVRIRLTGAGFDRYTRLGGDTAPGEVALPAPEILGGHEITGALTDALTDALTGQGMTLTVRATEAAPGPRPPKVSVVVPTAGAAPEAVETTLASLAAQTLPADDIEVITAADAAPGTDPRNAGTDTATGEYVLYMEPGDRLGAEALERMYAYGIEHDADIVAGKLAGKGRPVPRELFVRDRPRATLAKDPLADSLTANKLFHRAFLEEHKLRFQAGGRQPGPVRPIFVGPERLARRLAALSESPKYGRAIHNADPPPCDAPPWPERHGGTPCTRLPRADPRRSTGQDLAEQAFTAEATLRAGRTAVLGSYVCYHYGPGGAGPAVPPGEFYAELRALLKTVDGLVGPGAARDRLHRRWLRVEILDRLSGKRLLDLDEDARRELFRAIRGVVVDGISDTSVAGLPAARRVAVGLITDDRLDDLVALAAWESSVGCHARLDALSWLDDGGCLRIAFTGELHGADGPLGVTDTAADTTTGTDTGTRTRTDQEALAPAGLSPALRDRLAREPLTGGASPAKASVVLVLRERAGGAEYRLPTKTTVFRPEGVLSVAGTARLDLATALDGAPLGDGVWDLSVRLTALGFTKSARLGSRRGPEVPERLAPVPHPTARDRRVTPYWTNPQSDLSLRVAAPKPEPSPTPATPSRTPGPLRRLARRLRSS